MDILIGREGNQPFPLTEASISRKHALFHMDERSGAMTLRDNGSANGTYIKIGNGGFKRISGSATVGFQDIIRLGAIQTFQIKDLLPKSTPPANDSEDISHLRNVYDIYNANRLTLEAQTSNIMMMRLGAMSLSGVIALIASTVIPEDMMSPSLKVIIQVVSVVVALGLAWIVVGIKNKNLIRRKDQNEQYFKKHYCCPKCGYHFGNHVYNNILAQGQCPNKSCKCKFTGK